MQNSMVIFTFSIFEQKYPFWTNLVQKNLNFQLKLKFGIKNNSNMQNSMVMFTFSVFFYRKCPLWANLVQNIKIVSSNWNLAPRLIQVWRIQWWCSLFSFSTEEKHFLGKFGPKIQNCLKWDLVPRLIPICRIQ